MNTAGTLVGSTYTTIPTIGCGVAATNDVWYSFVAQSTNPIISLSSAPPNPRVQLFSGTCGALAPVSCGNTSGVLASSGLTIGVTYYVRVYTDPNDAGTFNICVTDPPPSNDLCSGAITLTSSGTCVNTSGTLLHATYTAIPTIGCGVASRNDVWYRFVAQTTNPTITLSSTPANPRLQLFSGTCAALTSIACGNNSITATGLTIGNTYFIRVYTDPNVSGTFDICVTDPPPANDLCSGAISIISGTSCVNTAGTLTGATYTTIPTIGCGVASRNDVWYSFVAVTPNPTITLSSAPANSRVQLFSGSCAALAPLSCGNGSLVASGLTVGTTYFVRIYADPDVTGTFNICITDPLPTNNLCGSVITLTSNTTCINTAGNMYNSTVSTTTISGPNCATGVIRDVWYRFVAQSTNPTITLSSLGVNFTNAGMQLLSNDCGGTFTTYFCGTTSIAADFLVPGTTYYIRVYTTSAAVPASLVGWNFNICVTDPVPPVPPNDECANAINLLISASCSNVPGTVTGSTASPLGTFGCSGTVAYDVWYKFTAVSASSTIDLTSAGSNFNTPRMQLFSGNCGTLTSLTCSSSGSITQATVAGTTYYVRVYSATGPAPNGNADFNICVAASGALVRFGNSYVNVTRKTTGGVVQTGDVLEIRMTINHTSGIMTNLRYVDNLPTHTAIANTAPHDSIKIITNEGLRYKKYTLASGDDAGTFLASPPAGQYNIRLNLGFGSTVPGTPANNTSTEFTSATGSMNAASHRPRGGGGMLFAVAYRVVVTGVAGDTIQLNPGQFIYRNGGGDITL